MEGDYDYGRLWKLTEGWRGDLESYSVDARRDDPPDRPAPVADRRPAGAGQAAGQPARHRGHEVPLDDLVVALLELESGATMKVTANFGCVHPHFHDVKVFGRDATFVNGLEQATLWTPGDDGPRAELLDSPYPGVEKGDLIDSFVEAVGRRAAADRDRGRGVQVLATCFAIDRAAPIRGRRGREDLRLTSAWLMIPFGKPMLGDEERSAVADVLAGTILTHGPRVKDFEARVRRVHRRAARDRDRDLHGRRCTSPTSPRARARATRCSCRRRPTWRRRTPSSCAARGPCSSTPTRAPATSTSTSSRA